MKPRGNNRRSYGSHNDRNRDIEIAEGWLKVTGKSAARCTPCMIAPVSKGYLAAASNKHILVRMLYNLKGIYQQQDRAEETISVINKVLVVDSHFTIEYREPRLLLNQLECYYTALKDIRHYSAFTPDLRNAGQSAAWRCACKNSIAT